MSAPDAAMLALRYNVTSDFALGYWWINVYQEGWLSPIASFGPCVSLGRDQVTQVQHDVRRWLEKTVRDAIEARMDTVSFMAERRESRGRYLTKIGLAQRERVEADEDGGIAEYKFQVPPEIKQNDA